MEKVTLEKKIFCPVCDKVVTHRYVFEQEDLKINPEEVSKGEPNEETKKKMKERSDRIEFLLKSPRIKWECWGCKSKKRTTKNYSENPFLVLFAKFSATNPPKTEDEKRDMMLESLAKVISYLEDRVSYLEELFEGSLIDKPRRRGINVIEKNR